MKITLKRAELVDALGNIKKIIPAKAAVPALAGVLVTIVGEDAIELVGTDMTSDIKIRVGGTMEGEGEILVGCEKLLSMASAMTGDTITLSNDGDDPRIVITDGKSKFRLVVITDAEKMPAIFGRETVFGVVEASDLGDALVQTMFAADVPSSNKLGSFPGVFFEMQDDGTVKCVATNRKKLATCKCKSEQSIDCSDTSKSTFFMPIHNAEVLKSFCKSGKCEISRFNNMVTFKFDNVEYNTVLLTTAFPNYATIVNSVVDCQNKLVTDTRELCSVVNRAMLVVTATLQNAVKLSLSENRLVVSAKSAEYGTYEEEMLCSYTGDEIEVIVDGLTFTEMLKCFIETDVTVLFKGQTAPLKLVSGNAEVVYMPLK